MCTINNIESVPLWKDGESVGRGKTVWRLVRQERATAVMEKEKRGPQKKKSENRDSDGEAVVAQTFMFRCESTLTTDCLKQLLPKGFIKTNHLNGVADLTEGDITTSITMTGSTVRTVALTIKAGVERERWVGEIAIPEAVVNGQVKLSRNIAIQALPGLPRFGNRKMHRHAIDTTIGRIERPSPRLTRTEPAPRQLLRGRMRERTPPSRAPPPARSSSACCAPALKGCLCLS